MAGRFRSLDELAPDDWRRNNPRFQGENFTRNLAIADAVRAVAQDKGCTPAQLALAWLLARHPRTIPIPGTSSVERLEENAQAILERSAEPGCGRRRRRRRSPRPHCPPRPGVSA